MENFIKVNSDLEILEQNISFENKTIIDAGCGTGKLVRVLAPKVYKAIGFDKPELLKKATETEYPGNVEFVSGLAQKMPVENSSADVVLFFASFHHIPENEMSDGISEIGRVLKPGGTLCFLEPVARDGSYYDITRLVEDEKEIQQKAYKMIKSVDASIFAEQEEKFYYLERSFQDYKNLLSVYVPDEQLRNNIIEKAEQVIKSKGENPDEIRFKSLCRLNVFKRIN